MAYGQNAYSCDPFLIVSTIIRTEISSCVYVLIVRTTSRLSVGLNWGSRDFRSQKILMYK